MRVRVDAVNLWYSLKKKNPTKDELYQRRDAGIPPIFDLKLSGH